MIAGSKLVSFASVCCALAVGVALGAGPLHDSDADATTDDGQRRTAARPVAGSYPDTFAAAVAPTLYARRLADQSVALVTLPGADPTIVKALTDGVVAAGGVVASRTDVTTGLTAPGQKVLVDTLGSQLAEQLPGLADPAATTYPRMGRLLAAAVATTSTAAAPSPQSVTVRESLVAAELASDPGTGNVAPLVLVVAGEDLEDTIAGGLVSGLAAGAHGVVVAAPSKAPDLAPIREAAAAVATVDGVETAAGQAAAVLALVRQVTGGGGSFGASGIDGALPLG